jgi:hypothetical protein
MDIFLLANVNERRRFTSTFLELLSNGSVARVSGFVYLLD